MASGREPMKVAAFFVSWLQTIQTAHDDYEMSNIYFPAVERYCFFQST